MTAQQLFGVFVRAIGLYWFLSGAGYLMSAFVPAEHYTYGTYLAIGACNMIAGVVLMLKADPVVLMLKADPIVEMCYTNDCDGHSQPDLPEEKDDSEKPVSD